MKILTVFIPLIVLASCNIDLNLDSDLPQPSDHVTAGSFDNDVAYNEFSIHSKSASWEDVFKSAKKDRKPIFVYGYAAWCTPCLFVNRTLLTDPTVVAYFSTNFITMNFQMETITTEHISEAWDILEEYNIELEAYPIYLFFDSKGELVSQLRGVPSATTLINEAQKALDASKEPK